MQHLPATPQRQQLLAQIDQGRECLVESGVLVEEVAVLGALAAEAAAEHALAEHQVRAARTPAAVEALLGAVIDAGDAHRGELRCDAR